MATTLSTTQEIVVRIASACAHELKKIDNTYENNPLRKSVEDAFAIAIAPEIKQLERLIYAASKEGNPLTATSKLDNNMGQLESWGNIKLKRDPAPATPGEYRLAITGTGTIPAGTGYTDQETNFVYITQTDTTITGSGYVDVLSVGEGTELVKTTGTALYCNSSIPGIEQEAIISEILTTPVAAESTESYKNTTVQSFSLTPRGGSRADYIFWGLQVSGVSNIFPYANTPGTGEIYIQATQSETNKTGTASQSLVDDVREYITNEEPMNTGVNYFYSVQESSYIVTIQNLTDAGKEAAILAALQDYFAAKRPFIDGIDIENERTDLVKKADIYNVVSDACGDDATFDELTITRNGLEITNEYLIKGHVGNPSVVLV